MSLNGSAVLGVLSDISGVLSESSAQGDGVAIAGSPEAIVRYNNYKHQTLSCHGRSDVVVI